MMTGKFKDRRSVQAEEGAGNNKEEVEAVLDAAKEAAAAGPSTAPRRLAPGARTFSQFFASDKQSRPLTRGELLNLLSMLEYQRYESTPWRRLWRWLHHLPQVGSFLPAMREAHRRTLEDAKERIEQKAAEMKLALVAAKEKHSRDVEGKPRA